MYISAGGGGPDGETAVRQIRTIVIYDQATGRVIHTHHAVTFVGGQSLSDEELRARALKLAHEAVVRSGRTVPSRLEALRVDPASIAPGVEYRVDPKQRTLVAEQVIATLVKPSGRRLNQKRAKAPKASKRR
jgi:hypothetical protein